MGTETGDGDKQDAYLHYLATILREAGWQVTEPDPDAVFHVRTDAPDTSKELEPKVRIGSARHSVLLLFEHYQAGLTDDELEVLLGLSHQTVSAARNVLVRRGLVYDSGSRDLTRSGNKAIVWKRSNRPLKGTDHA